MAPAKLCDPNGQAGSNPKGRPTGDAENGALRPHPNLTPIPLPQPRRSGQSSDQAHPANGSPKRKLAAAAPRSRRQMAVPQPAAVGEMVRTKTAPRGARGWWKQGPMIRRSDTGVQAGGKERSCDGEVRGGGRGQQIANHPRSRLLISAACAGRPSRRTNFRR